MVRIMKSRNVLSWNELTSESIRALKDRFQPNPRVLKKRLESLIEREFMSRDAGLSRKMDFALLFFVF
jgi:hypothetical protein